MQHSGDFVNDAGVDQDADYGDDFRDMETTRRVTSEMGLAVHGDLGCYQYSQLFINIPVSNT